MPVKPSLPEPPYYAVIFTSLRTTQDEAGYRQMAAVLEDRAACQPGFLGIESIRDAAGIGVTVSYWSDLDAITLWKQQVDHLQAQQQGRDEWYQYYRVQISRVERRYEFES